MANLPTTVLFGASGNVGLPTCVALLGSPPPVAGTRLRLVTRHPAALAARLTAAGLRAPDASHGCDGNAWTTPTGWLVALVVGDLTTVDAPALAALLAPAEHGSPVTRVGVCLPQACDSAAMTAIVSRLAAVLGRLRPLPVVVKLSSFGLEWGAGQGPLGEAHLADETALRGLGLTVTRVRPTSFSSNLLAWDVPAIRARDAFASPLGATAAVNWVAVADIGRVFACALVHGHAVL